MLVLTRRIGETVKIGEDIEIHILDIDRGQIRIGIDAPKHINIVRSELIGRREKDNLLDNVELPEKILINLPSAHSYDADYIDRPIKYAEP